MWRKNPFSNKLHADNGFQSIEIGLFCVTFTICIHTKASRYTRLPVIIKNQTNVY